MKIKISKERIILLILPIFCLVVFILELIYGEESFNKFLALGGVAFLYQLGQKIGSFDAQVKGVSNRLGIVEKKVL